jgi:ABC-type uncharacterized transport system fused permease/ATPase subunit
MLKDEENIKNDDNNIEQEITTEETIVEDKEEAEEALEESVEEEVKDLPVETEEIKDKQVGFLAKLGASIIDQCVSLIISFVLLYLFNVILIPFGYKVGDKILTFLVIYAIINILYGIIIEATKLKKTVGKSVLKL